MVPLLSRLLTTRFDLGISKKLVSTLKKFYGRHHNNVNPIDNMAVSRSYGFATAEIQVMLTLRRRLVTSHLFLCPCLSV